MESITNHGVHLSGNLEYTLLKNLDLNTSDNLDVSIASFDTQIGRFQPVSRGTNNDREMYDSLLVYEQKKLMRDLLFPTTNMAARRHVKTFYMSFDIYMANSDVCITVVMYMYNHLRYVCRSCCINSTC